MRAPDAEGRLERDGVSLRWVEWRALSEDAQPPLFLLHGLSSNALFWSRLAARFPHRRVVALDQRSHGLSDRPAAGYEVDVLAADAAAAIGELGIHRPVVAGHSWGATVALCLAAGRPDLVSGLAVIDGPVQPVSERMSWEDAERFMQPPIPRHPDLEAAYRHQAQYLDEAWGPDLEEFVRAGHLRDGEAWVMTLSAQAREQALRGLFAFQPQLLWPQVKVPVLLALAGADAAMRSWKESGAAAVAAFRPDADVRWYDSRHDIPLIRADEVAADLERLAIRVAFAEAGRVAAGLEGDFERRAIVAEGGQGGWTARQLLAHLASTQSALAAVLSAPPPAPGTETRPFDPERWNATQLSRREAATVPELLAELDAGVAATDGALRAADMGAVVGAGPYAGLTVADAMRHMAVHQQDHLRELATALR